MELIPNTPIGMIVSQECTAPATQTSLSSFHKVGSNTSESINVAKLYSRYLRFESNIDDDIIYVVPVNMDDIDILMKQMTNLTLKQLVVSHDINYSEYSDVYYKYYKQRSDVKCVRLMLDKAIMYLHRIDLFHLKYIIECSIKDTLVIPSTVANATLEISYTDMYKDVSLLVYDLLFANNIQVHGVKGIYPLRMVKDKYIVCKGSNITGIAKLHNVDMSKTFTSNIATSYMEYGIEITKEVMKIHINYMFGSSINSRALDILINNMLVYGKPIPVSYRGVIEQHRSILFNLCYEHFSHHIKQVPLSNEFKIHDLYDKLAVGLPL